MGIDAGHCDARRIEAGGTEIPVSEIERPQDTLLGDVLGDLGQRDMRGDAGVPELLQHVELAGRALERDRVAHEADLVVIAGIGEAHRRLVEGREEHRICLAGGSEAQRAAEIIGRGLAAGERRLAALEIGRIMILEIDEDRLAGVSRQGVTVADDMQVGRQAGIGGAELEQAVVAEDDVARGLAEIGLGQDAGGEFGADAGWIAHGDRDHRQGSVRVHLVLPRPASTGCLAFAYHGAHGQSKYAVCSITRSHYSTANPAAASPVHRRGCLRLEGRRPSWAARVDSAKAPCRTEDKGEPR